MTFFCNMVYFITVLLFGTAVSYCFAGIPISRKNLLLYFLFCSLEGTLHLLLSGLFGIDAVKQLYPLVTHLPLILFLMLAHQCGFLSAVTSVLSAYLCCQIPWWFSYVGNLLFPGKIAHTILYVLSALAAFFLIYRYIAGPAVHFIRHSRVSALLIGAVPFFYYVFDYATTVYTDWLYRGNTTAVQFMPSVLACFYFLFLVVYYQELSLKEEARHQAETLELQLQYAASTLDNMRQLQENTVLYRHDMRHHLNYIQALVTSKNTEKLLPYIQSIQSDIEAVTPRKFCLNEVVNLILSTYALKAKKKGISMDVYALVPEELSISDTDLCAILSNALDNAQNAADAALEKTVSVRLTVRSSSLLIQISNSFSGSVHFKDQLPVSSRENHGLGTKSIAAIVDSYGGQYSFSARDQTFTLRLLLPL